MSNRTVDILLVEDDQVDAEAIQRAMQKAEMKNPLVLARDGAEALQVLRGEIPEKQLNRPFLVILDLNLPKVSGTEFLDAIRKDSKLANTIIFVLTTSDDDGDILDSYRENVAGYLVKSKAGPEFQKLTGLLKHFVDIVEFPRQPAARE